MMIPSNSGGAFLDEGPKKKSFISWMKKAKYYSPQQYPEIVKLYHPIFFEGSEFFRHTWYLVDSKRPDFWKGVTEILEHLMLACGIDMLSILTETFEDHHEDILPLSLNFFSFENEKLNNPQLLTTNEQIADAILEGVYKSPEYCVESIVSSLRFLSIEETQNIARFFSNKRTLSPNAKIMIPTTIRVSMTTAVTEEDCKSALKVIPQSLMAQFTERQIEFAVNSIIFKNPEIMMCAAGTAASSSTILQLELFARMLAIPEEDGNNARKPEYRISANFSCLRSNWTCHGEFFSCMAHGGLTAECLRRYHSIIKGSPLLSSISPWNENTLFKVAIAATWYKLLLFPTQTLSIQDSFNAIFETIKKWKA
jgi:hypothetical protein